MTRGVWGIVKNGESKLIYNSSDSYPAGLGKDVIFTIQNGLDKLNEIFEKIIFIKSMNNLDSSEYKYVLRSPSDCVTDDLLEKYYAEKTYGNYEEYGYLINLDEHKLILFKDNKMAGEIDFKSLNYLQMAGILQ